MIYAVGINSNIPITTQSKSIYSLTHNKLLQKCLNGLIKLLWLIITPFDYANPRKFHNTWERFFFLKTSKVAIVIL